MAYQCHWRFAGPTSCAIDFTTVELWTTKGLVTYYLLFAMHLATRRVQFVGCTASPGGPWMLQMARNLTDAFDGFLRQPIRYLLLDRDTKFTAEFSDAAEGGRRGTRLAAAQKPQLQRFSGEIFPLAQSRSPGPHDSLQ